MAIIPSLQERGSTSDTLTCYNYRQGIITFGKRAAHASGVDQFHAPHIATLRCCAACVSAAQSPQHLRAHTQARLENQRVRVNRDRDASAVQRREDTVVPFECGVNALQKWHGVRPGEVATSLPTFLPG